ncbi:MAG: transposase [Leptolyngbya sp. SIO4C1]|nr:transposase [Leptolyngbya sp. SIO4C1]
MGRSRYRVLLNTQPHFITCSTVEWMPIFSKPELVAILLNSLQFLQAQKRLTLYSYVIMENHLHLIAIADDLSKEVGNFKSFTARSIVDWLQANQSKSYWLTRLKAAKLKHKTGQRYQLWQEGFHPKMIASEAMLKQKLDYIHNNPVKRGYVDNPAHWRYSSYRNYMGEPGLLDVTIIG